MSTPVAKQTIIGSELPTGALYGYSYDLDTNTVYLVHCSSAGVFSRQAINPFPPTSFTLALSTFQTLSGSWSISRMEPVRSIYTDQLCMFYDGTTVWVNIPSGPLDIYTGDPSLYGSDSYSSTLTTYVTGLGKDGYGVDCYSIHVAIAYDNSTTLYGFCNVNIDSTKCLSDSSGVLSFGYCFDTSHRCHVLLNNETGYVAMFSTYGQSGTISATYYQLVIPSGGVIKQFANGYYLTTNGAGALFLYSVQNGGTLVSELTTDTYDPDASLAFFGLV